MEEKIRIRFNVLAIICIVLISFAVTPITLQNDTFYTIKIGEHIIQNGIDMKDPFSWHENMPYTYPHWAYDVATYGVYQLGENLGMGGMTTIYLATIFLSCVLGIVMYVVNLKLTKNPITSFLLTLGAMVLMKSFIAARAQLVTYILFILTVFFIERFLQTKKKGYAIGIVFVSWIIANIHVAVWPFFFILFLPYLAEQVLVWLRDLWISGKIQIGIEKRKQQTLKKRYEKTQEKEKQDKIKEKIKEKEEKQNKLEEKYLLLQQKQQKINEEPYKIRMKKEPTAKWLVVIIIFCALVGLLTPIQDTPYTYLYKTMKGTTTNYISEHQPTVFDESKVALVCITVAIVILMFTDTKIRLRDLFMITGLIYMTITSRRQFALLVIIGVFILNKLICSLLEKYDPKGTQIAIRFFSTWLGKAFTILLVILFSLLILGEKVGNQFIDPSSYPVDAANYIVDNLDVANIKLYNEYNYGSYLLYRGIPVFIDSRADLYDPVFNGKEIDIFKDFMDLSGIGVYFEQKFKEYGFTHAIVYKNAKLALFLDRDSRFTTIYQDDHFIIYEIHM